MSPRWHPDGTRFVYVSGPTPDADIMTARVDGSAEQRSTSTSALELQPTWSPDDSAIAYVSNADGDFDLYVMRADGSAPTRITDNAVAEYAPRWSPEGSWIALESELPGAGHSEVYWSVQTAAGGSA